MQESFYYYRGFEIGVQSQPVVESARSFPSSDPVCYRCVVRIRKADSVLSLDSFTIAYSGNEPFEDKFEAVLRGCHAAELRINLHHAMLAREPYSIDVVR